MFILDCHASPTLRLAGAGARRSRVLQIASNAVVFGCAPPITRRVVRSASSSVVSVLVGDRRAWRGYLLANLRASPRLASFVVLTPYASRRVVGRERRRRRLGIIFWRSEALASSEQFPPT